MTSRKRLTRRQVTLARLLSKFGIASRSEAVDWISRGRVDVNGIRARSADLWVDPRVDVVAVDGEPIRPRRPVYAVLHKPADVVTTRSDERGRTTVYAFVPPDLQYLFPVGRLDKESTGLLLLTNDVRLGDRVTNPVSHVPKTYLVTLDPPPDADLIRAWGQGLRLPDGTELLPARVRIVPTAPGQVQVTLVEGKNRQIRRMAEASGRKVKNLHRVAIGELIIGDLPPGGFRLLNPRELKLLLPGQTTGSQHDTYREPHR